MSTIIMLTAAQATQVRGPSVIIGTSSLEPVGLTDGRFFLPEEILADPAHALHYTLLNSCPKQAYEDLDPGLIPQSVEEEETKKPEAKPAFKPK